VKHWIALPPTSLFLVPIVKVFELIRKPGYIKLGDSGITRPYYSHPTTQLHIAVMGLLMSFVHFPSPRPSLLLYATQQALSLSDAKAESEFHNEKLEHSRVPESLTPTRPRPIPNSYWATPLLVACEYPYTPANPNTPKLDALLRAGVRTFIDLTECGELQPYCGDILTSRAEVLGIDTRTIEFHRFPIPDRCLPKSTEFMYSVMEVLKDNEKRGRITAVHCRGGIGRTGMVIGCWLVESGRTEDGGEALAVIAQRWKTVEKCTRYPHSPETGAQYDFVLHFKAAPKSLRTMVSVIN
jgi:protein-tyrosine phosphatase